MGIIPDDGTFRTDGVTQFFQVHAGAESSAVACENDDTDRIIIHCFCKSIIDGCNQCAAQGIAFVGPIERNPCDAIDS